ncbi:DHRS13, partial [Symbiodinium sp. CCMP2592]
PLPDGPLPLAGKREDLYFPTGASLGLKLRNGAGALEAKRRLRRSKEGVELWVKTLHEGCTAASSHGPRLELAAAKELELAPEEVESIGTAELPMLVRCRKSRRITDFGEEVDCVFIAETDMSVVLAERYQSISVESPRLEDIGPIVQQLGPVPEGAIVAGYPAIVQAVADRANSGLGYETSVAVLRAGASVIFACRNEKKATAAMKAAAAAAGFAAGQRYFLQGSCW